MQAKAKVTKKCRAKATYFTLYEGRWIEEGGRNKRIFIWWEGRKTFKPGFGSCRLHNIALTMPCHFPFLTGTREKKPLKREDKDLHRIIIIIAVKEEDWVLAKRRTVNCRSIDFCHNSTCSTRNDGFNNCIFRRKKVLEKKNKRKLCLFIFHFPRS